MNKNYTDIFKGVVSVKVENGVYTPFRLTQKQPNPTPSWVGLFFTKYLKRDLNGWVVAN